MTFEVVREKLVHELKDVFAEHRRFIEGLSEHDYQEYKRRRKERLDKEN